MVTPPSTIPVFLFLTPHAQVQTLDYSCIVFDTAPTGHTLRLLNFPTILEKGLSKLMSLKGAMGGMLGQVSRMMGGGEEDMTEQVGGWRGRNGVGGRGRGGEVQSWGHAGPGVEYDGRWRGGHDRAGGWGRGREQSEGGVWDEEGMGWIGGMLVKCH